jgi:hypothetical protein
MRKEFICLHRQNFAQMVDGTWCQTKNSKFRKFSEGIIQLILKDNFNHCNFSNSGLQGLNIFSIRKIYNSSYLLAQLVAGFQHANSLLRPSVAAIDHLFPLHLSLVQNKYK